MEIPVNLGNVYSAAPGTSQSTIRPQAGLSFEESNAAVDRAVLRTQEAQENSQARQETRRSSATELYSARQQQNSVELYLSSYAQASGGTSSSTSSTTPLTYENLQSASRAQAINEVTGTIDNLNRPAEPTPFEAPAESPQGLAPGAPETTPGGAADQLQSRINNLLGDGGRGENLLDVLA